MNFKTYQSIMDIIHEGKKTFESVGKLCLDLNTAGAQYRFAAPNQNTYFVDSSRCVAAKGMPGEASKTAIEQLLSQGVIYSSKIMENHRSGESKETNFRLYRQIMEICRIPIYDDNDESKQMTDSLPIYFNGNHK